jgi:hypothetical protein
MYTDIASISRSVFEIHDGPDAEIGRILVKGKIYRAFDKAAVVSPQQDESLAPESAFAGAGCGPSQDRMRERRADRGDGSLNFLLCRVHQSSMSDCPGLYRIDARIQIDRRQESMDKRAKASPMWPFAVSTLHRLHDDIRPGPRPASFFSRPVFCCGSLSRLARGLTM